VTPNLKIKNYAKISKFSSIKKKKKKKSLNKQKDILEEEKTFGLLQKMQ